VHSIMILIASAPVAQDRCASLGRQDGPGTDALGRRGAGPSRILRHEPPVLRRRSTADRRCVLYQSHQKGRSCYHARLHCAPAKGQSVLIARTRLGRSAAAGPRDGEAAPQPRLLPLSRGVVLTAGSGAAVRAGARRRGTGAVSGSHPGPELDRSREPARPRGPVATLGEALWARSRGGMIMIVRLSSAAVGEECWHDGPSWRQIHEGETTVLPFA
jgi:hypothetical protein